MNFSIKHLEFKIRNYRAFLSPIIFLCLSCANFVKVVEAQNSETLADRIRSGSTEIKRDALFEIRNRQNGEASRIAVSALRDKEEIIRATAAFSVIFLPKDEAFAALAPNLNDKSALVRRETAYALGKIRSPQAVPLLIQTFSNRKEKSIEVKNACIIALGAIGDASAIDFLARILKQNPRQNDDFLRRGAARAIGQIAQIIQIGDDYVVTPENFLPEKYKTYSLAEYRNLSENFPPFRAAVPILIQGLQNSRESADTKREIAFAFGAIGDDSAIPVLRLNSASEDYYLAEICKEALIKLFEEN